MNKYQVAFVGVIVAGVYAMLILEWALNGISKINSIRKLKDKMSKSIQELRTEQRRLQLNLFGLTKDVPDYEAKMTDLREKLTNIGTELAELEIITGSRENLKTK